MMCTRLHTSKDKGIKRRRWLNRGTSPNKPNKTSKTHKILKRTLVLIKQCYKTTSLVCFWVETNKLMNKKCSSSRQTANKLTNVDRNGVTQNDICFISDKDLGGINISFFLLLFFIFCRRYELYMFVRACACTRTHTHTHTHTLSLSLCRLAGTDCKNRQLPKILILV